MIINFKFNLEPITFLYSIFIINTKSIFFYRSQSRKLVFEHMLALLAHGDKINREFLGDHCTLKRQSTKRGS